MKAGFNIALRAPIISDAQPIFEMVEESIESTYGVQSWCCPGYSLKDAEHYIHEAQSMRQLQSEFQFLIYTTDTARLLGTTSIMQIDSQHQLAKMGYFIRASARGKGIAQTAAFLTAQFAFKERNLHRLELLIATHNSSSIRVAEKMAAQREGILRERLKWNDTFHDAYLYSLLNKDNATLKAETKIGQPI